jgi:L-lactate dehydrogenase complex protein LldG
MSPPESSTEADTRGPLDRFEARAAAVGLETSRVAAETATAAIEAACRGATVGSPLGSEVSLPSSVTVDPTREELLAAETGVTAGTLAIAAYGTVVVTPSPNQAGAVSLFPPRHVAVVRAADVVPDMAAAFDRLAEAFAAGRDDAVFVTGPSATADMGELVQGVHGPAEMHVVVVEGST